MNGDQRVEDDEPRVEKVLLPEPRPLTQRERALIDFLLAGPLGRDELRQQAELAQVAGICSCGCLSVFLQVDPSAPSATFTADEVPSGRTDWVPITAYQPKSRGSTEVTLHVCGGYMHEFEIWGHRYGLRPRIDLVKLEYFDWSDAVR